MILFDPSILESKVVNMRSRASNKWAAHKIECKVDYLSETIAQLSLTSTALSELYRYHNTIYMDIEIYKDHIFITELLSYKEGYGNAHKMFDYLFSIINKLNSSDNEVHIKYLEGKLVVGDYEKGNWNKSIPLYNSLQFNQLPTKLTIYDNNQNCYSTESVLNNLESFKNKELVFTIELPV